jgi:hypothetical protein
MSTKYTKSISLIVLLLLLLTITPLTSAQETATISGVIRHDGNPVANVFIVIFWEGGEAFMETGADGAYNASGIPNGAWLMYHIRPPVEQRLEYRNGRIENVTGNMAKDFDLQSGYLLSGEFQRPDGAAIDGGFWLGIGALDGFGEDGEWPGDGADGGRFAVVLRPGNYSIMPPSPENEDERPDSIKPYYFPSTQIDLTNGDVTGLVITLVETFAAKSDIPPRVDLITVSVADNDGNATVTGAPGAVEPMTVVAVFNLSANTFSVAAAGADGSFTTTLYAPTGSAVLVKYSAFDVPIYAMWNEALGEGIPPGGNDINPLPGAIFQVGPSSVRSENSQSFDLVGAHITEEPRGWIGWQLSGTIHAPVGSNGSIIQRGQLVALDASLRLTSPDFDCANPQNYHAGGHIAMQYAFDNTGNVNPWGIWFTSYLFTPTGLPIEHETFGEIYDLGRAEFTNPTCVGEHTIEFTTNTFTEAQPNVPDGVFSPFIMIDPGNVPLSVDVPMNTVWYKWEGIPSLPPLVVGNPATPRIPWTLLANYPVNGHRGVQAREDVGHFMMPTRVMTPPFTTVIPMLDERTGEPLQYRLEPGSHWISASERRQPNPPYIPFDLPSGNLTVTVTKPDGSIDTLGPATISQSSVTTPTTPGGVHLDHGTGQASDIYHLTTMDDSFAYNFDQYGAYLITLTGSVNDVYGNSYPISNNYDLVVADTLDLDPGQLPTTPYIQGNSFAPNLHIFPPVAADVTIKVTHLPYSDPNQTVTHIFSGRANRFGIFQPQLGDVFSFDTPGEFRVDISASYYENDGTLWAGTMTWGNVVEGTNSRIEAHGRRTMAHLPTDPYAPTWYEISNLPLELTGIETCYPYFSGDIHWGSQTGPGPGDSIQAIITFKDKTPDQMFYNLLGQYMPQDIPPDMQEAPWETAISVGEAPLETFTYSGRNPAAFPEDIAVWSYFYGSSERPDVRVREIIGSPWVATVYWRYDDTYGYQIGESAEGDLPGDIKWQFGGAVIRTADGSIAEYGAYSSLWVLLPDEETIGARITPPFQDATGASINGGPIMTLNGEEIDMLFLPKSIRPGDVLELGDVIAFSGHVGPPLDSQVTVRITSPSGVVRERVWYANRIGWLYDPTFDFVSDESGRWTVDIAVLHDRPYVGNGVIPMSHNSGTVLGTSGQYEFYVVPVDSERLQITSPQPGFITWPKGHVEPLVFQGISPSGTTAIHYTVHDKGVVMDQGIITPNSDGKFTLTYDARALHEIFPFLSLTAHEGRWEGLSDEVAISMLAVGGDTPASNTITLIGEEIFIGTEE